jgi:hypothetical protein
VFPVVPEGFVSTSKWVGVKVTGGLRTGAGVADTLVAVGVGSGVTVDVKRGVGVEGVVAVGEGNKVGTSRGIVAWGSRVGKERAVGVQAVKEKSTTANKTRKIGFIVNPQRKKI